MFHILSAVEKLPGRYSRALGPGPQSRAKDHGTELRARQTIDEAGRMINVSKNTHLVGCPW